MRNKTTMALLICLVAWSAAAQPAASTGPAPTAGQPAPPPATPPADEINQAGSFGFGPLLGGPMGLTLKYWLSDKSAVDGALGWSFADPDGFQLHADYLYHVFDLFHIESGQLPLYFGVGGRVKFVQHGDNRAGVRGPIGIAYLLPNTRMEVFGEVAPVLDFAPSTRLEWNGGVGLRFYLH